MKTEILGCYAITNKVTIRPNKKCIDCPFFEEGTCWCNWLKKRIDKWYYYEDCPIIEIGVEEV